MDWQPIDNGNVRVLNDTADFYRFFDATPQAEFLKRYDAFRSQLNLMVDMPDRLSDLLLRFLHQNGGRYLAVAGKGSLPP